jgi:hypothetical protein
MEWAIRLDHQPMAETDEVNDIGTDPELSPKLEAVEAAVAQDRPEEAFG